MLNSKGGRLWKGYVNDMTKYNISGCEIEIPESVENYIRFMKEMKPYRKNIKENFNRWYTSQGNCQNVNNNISSIWATILDPIINKGIDLLNGLGVYDIDYEMFVNRYLGNSLNCFLDALDDMMCEIEDISQTQSEAREYRQLRKANRSRMIGGGFGLGGAVKGMVQAGAINATTGALHSVGNAIGNTGSAIAAGTNKAAVYFKYKGVLENEMEDAAEMTIGAVMRCIQKNTELEFDYIIDGKGPNEDISNSILNNYRAGRIPDERKLEQLIKALKNELEEVEVYQVIWDEYGDANGDLRRMADFFGVPLEKQILMIANNHCKKILVNCCKPYEYKEDMALQAAIKIEKNLLFAMDEIKKYCRERDVEERNIIHAGFCEKLLEEIDAEYRTVDGIVYGTREIAEVIKNDKALFHNFLRDKNIYEDEIQDEAGRIDFQSEYYKRHLSDIVEREAGLRDASKIFSNLKEIMCKYFPDGKTQLGDIES